MMISKGGSVITKDIGNLYIYSGECNMGRVGDPVGANDANGKPLHVGDIVQLIEGICVGTDIESWVPLDWLTAIVSDQFISYQNGILELKEGEIEYFCMGIKSCGFDSPKWKIRIVKGYQDVIDGEHWSNFGFSYRRSVAADELLNVKENVNV